MANKYSIVFHDRWLESEEPLATVVYSSDGWKWHEICTCSPEWAEEIAIALEKVEENKNLRADLEEAYDACRYALANSPRWKETAATVVATWEQHHRD